MDSPAEHQPLGCTPSTGYCPVSHPFRFFAARTAGYPDVGLGCGRSKPARGFLPVLPPGGGRLRLSRVEIEPSGAERPYSWICRSARGFPKAGGSELALKNRFRRVIVSMAE